ncbi:MULTISPECIES: DNA topoisomerase IB [unclassified Yoonia]|uniref:DNA topoisomerase IB n=1 Tax=unclassified Yoonia TaxID=2629118 RepID=UPI002AFEEA69|nr:MULTISPECIES: DNA topoisomerase IB [unclassified Yoonia]
MIEAGDLGDAGLIYVTDTTPGLLRIGAGRGFYYRDARGRKVTDTAVLHRIKTLAIPPAWTDVWICPDAKGHLQATGRDAKGRKQYIYHPDWSAMRDAAKFSSLSAFADALPDLRQTVERDMRKPPLSPDRVLAVVVWLLDRTLIRIGNDIYAAENKSYGLTTLRARHLDLNGAKLRFSFTGKSGQAWALQVTDRRIANTVRQLQDLPGQRLFRYPDTDGQLHEIHSQDVNAYMRAAMGQPFTSKHFRTWGATVQAAEKLAQTDTPPTPRERARVLNSVVDEVASRLHHTRTVCRTCYIHPAVLTEWEKGELGAQMGKIRQYLRGQPRGLNTDEVVLRRWLDRHADAGQPP